MSLSQYARFLVVGGFVGLVTVVCRELIGSWLKTDTALRYSVSVVAAYGIGILLNFLLNRRFTFGLRAGRRDWSMFMLYAVVAVSGLLSTWLLALALRYGLQLDAIIGHFARTAAFATAALLSSMLTYPLSTRFVFRPDAACAARLAPSAARIPR